MASPLCLEMNTVNLVNLDKLVGKNIKDICDHYHDNSDSQCAHFVSHVMRYKSTQSPALCTNVPGSKILKKGSWTKQETRSGYTIRVDDIFNECRNRERWSAGHEKFTCIIVATTEENIKKENPLTIGSMKRKHIGFHVGGKIYHYSNSRNKVVKQPVSEFKNHYGGDTVLLRCDLPESFNCATR